MNKYNIEDYDIDDIIYDNTGEEIYTNNSKMNTAIKKNKPIKMTEKQMIVYVEKNDNTNIIEKITIDDFDKYSLLQKAIIKKIIGYATKSRGKFINAILLISHYKIKNVFQKILEKFLKYSFNKNNMRYWETPLNESFIEVLSVDNYDNLLVIEKKELLTQLFLVNNSAYDMIKLYPDKFLDTNIIMSLESIICNYINKNTLERIFDLILTKKTDIDAKKIIKQIIKLVVDNKLDSISTEHKEIIIELYEKYNLDKNINDEISHLNVILIKNEKDILTFTEKVYNNHISGINDKQNKYHYYYTDKYYNNSSTVHYYTKISNKLIELANNLALSSITETIMKIFTLIMKTRGENIPDHDKYDANFFSQVIAQNKIDLFIKYTNNKIFMNNLIYHNYYDIIGDKIKEDYGNIKYISCINPRKYYKVNEIKKNIIEYFNNKVENIKESEVDINIKRTYIFLNLINHYNKKSIDDFLNNKFILNQDEFNIILDIADGIILGEIFTMGKFKFPINKMVQTNITSLINCIPEFKNKILNASINDFMFDTNHQNNLINHKLTISLIRRNINLIDYYYDIDKLIKNLNEKENITELDIFMAYNIKYRFNDELNKLDEYFNNNGISKYKINTIVNNCY